MDLTKLCSIQTLNREHLANWPCSMPTVPPWVSWYRRLRPTPRGPTARGPGARGPAGRGPTPAPARLAVYTGMFNSQDDRNLHLIRLEDLLDNIYQLPPSSNEWVKRLNTNGDIWRSHFAADSNKIHRKNILDYGQRGHNYPPISVVVPGGGAAHTPSLGGAAGGRAARAHGGSVWGGWAAGAVLLALLVLVVRAAEKCLDRRLFKNRRRQSEEWPTPNVMATSLQHHTVDVGSLPQLDDSEFSSQGQRSSDLPPPYSECALKNNANVQKSFSTLSSEEPPPPYSDCLVAFSNKDIPTVHIHRRRTIDEPQTSSELDNVQNDLIETRHRIDHEDNNYDDSTMRVELVFDNGRIVERTIDINSTDNVPELVANVGETVIGSGSVDDSIVETNSQDRVIFV